MADHNPELFAKLETIIKNYPGPATNPHNLRNNCVFVTMARLMNMTLDEFLNHIETMQPAPEENGIPVNAILQMLKDTKKACNGNIVSLCCHGAVYGEDKVSLICLVRSTSADVARNLDFSIRTLQFNSPLSVLCTQEFLTDFYNSLSICKCPNLAG